MGLEIKVWFSLIFKNAFITFAFKGRNPTKFFRENEIDGKLPFSENLKLKISRFRKIAIGSEQWTCMLCIRRLDKVNEEGI